MAATTLTLTSGRSNFPHSLAFGKSDDDPLRDVSLISSYVNGGTDESFVLKLADYHLSNGSGLYSVRKKVEDGEIGVFGAEKYFNGRMDQGKLNSNRKPNMIAYKIRGTNEEEKDKPPPPVSARRSLHQKNELEGIGFESKIQRRTPSMVSESSFMRSEYSSWDSQSALLTSRHPPPRNNKTKITSSRKSLLSCLRSRCSCSDKNSVETGEAVVGGGRPITTGAPELGLADQLITNRRSESWPGKEAKATPAAIHPKKLNELGIGVHQRENCFAFPGGAGKLAVKLQLGDEGVMTPRKSLEIFGSPVMLEKGHKCLSLERRLTMLSWEATPRVEEEEGPAGTGSAAADESDASSDLFEIECLSSRVAPFLTRQESDGMSGCITPTTCYAPSEASIEWSVVTGSVADYSVMSDCDDLIKPPSVASCNTYRPVFTATTAPAKSGGKEVVAKRRPSSINLSGCKNDKAVRVARDAHDMRNDRTISDQRGGRGQLHQHHRSAAHRALEAHGFASPTSFSPSHSQHTSRLLYINQYGGNGKKPQAMAAAISLSFMCCLVGIVIMGACFSVKIVEGGCCQNLVIFNMGDSNSDTDGHKRYLEILADKTFTDIPQLRYLGVLLMELGPLQSSQQKTYHTL